jgi:hypothetical protein
MSLMAEIHLEALAPCTRSRCPSPRQCLQQELDVKTPTLLDPVEPDLDFHLEKARLPRESVEVLRQRLQQEG